jgi:hypothetical protein
MLHVLLDHYESIEVRYNILHSNIHTLTNMIIHGRYGKLFMTKDIIIID